MLADVAFVNFSGLRIERKTPWIAEADSKKFGANFGGVDSNAIERSGADERIVGGNFVGILIAGRVRVRREIARLFVHVDAHNGGKEILIDLLGIVEIVAGAAVT